MVKKEIARALSKASGETVSPKEVDESPVADYGAPIGFKLAGKKRKKPEEVSKEIASKIEASGLIKKVRAEKGYVNFTINPSEFTRRLLDELMESDSEYGRSDTPHPGKVILEHTSVNPSGPIHVGRLRNTVIGDSLRRILDYYGYNVETHYFVNDIGKQIAIIALGLDKHVGEDRETSSRYGSYAHKPDFQVFFTYVKANRLYEEDEGFRQEVDQLIRDAESGDEEAMEKITSAAHKALEGQKETYDRLGVEFDFYDFESKDLKEGRVRKVLRRAGNCEIYVESEIGAGVDLSHWGIEKQGGFTVLQRSDGTTVYLARDLAYHLEKLKLGDHLINVLGEDHKLQARELKLILEHVFNVDADIDVVHFSFVNFEDGQFSTRKGEIAPADMLLDEATEKAEKEIEKREIGDPQDAPNIGLGAVKFGLLKTVPNKPITFSWDKALDFEGESAPYIQYAHARSCRILEKSGIEIDSISLSGCSFELENSQEKNLLLILDRFPDVVSESASQLRPDILAQYLLELASAYGGFYMNCPVLDSPKPVKKRRLLIVYHTKEILRKGLNLLGVAAPERM